MSWNWSKVFRFLVIALLPLTILVIVLMMLSNILLPFLVGLGAAYLLDPLADRLERLRFSRIAATSIIAIGVFLVLALVLLILLPPLATQTAQLAAELPGYVEGLRDRVLPAITRLMERFSVTSDLSATGLIKEQSGKAISVGVDWASGLLQSSVAFLNLISLLFVTPIVTFYMLRDWDRMIAKVQSLVPPDHRQTYEKLGDQIDEVLAGFIRGQGLVCSFLAVFYALGLWLVGLKYGLLIGLFTGLASFVPFIGMALGLLVGLSVAAFQFQDFWMISAVAGVFALGQFIEGNLISPRLVGSRIHLHPVWVIFAVLAGTTLFGFFGTLLAVPFAAVVGVFIRFGVERYQHSELYHPSHENALVNETGNLITAEPEEAGPDKAAAGGETDDHVALKTGTA